MSVYLIADIKVTDDGWVPEYATNVHKLVEKHGGRYLSRSGNIETLGKSLWEWFEKNVDLNITLNGFCMPKFLFNIFNVTIQETFVKNITLLVLHQ